MSPRARLLLAFTCVVAFLLAQGLVSIATQRSLQREVALLSQAHDDANRLRLLLAQTHTEVTLLLGTHDPRTMDRCRHRQRKAMGDLLDLARQQRLDLAPFQQLQAAQEAAIDLHYQFAFNMARTRFGQATPVFEAASAVVNDHLTRTRELKESILKRSSSTAQRISFVLAICAIGTALILAFHLAKVLTDRRRAEESIAQALTQLESVLEAATQVAIIMTDREGVIRLFNPGAETMLGWKAEEAVGHLTLDRLHDPKDIGALRDTRPDWMGLSDFETLVETARLSAADRRTFRVLTRDGNRRTVDLAVTPVRDHDGQLTGFLEVATDITQRVDAEAALRTQEEQLRQAQKMDAIGQLAGGVAHDFNNMLSGILGATELIQEMCDPSDERHQLAGLAITASHRAADLTGKLLAFSRKGKLRSEPVNLNHLTEETRELLRRSIDRRIQLQVDLMARQPVTQGDPSQLQNALLNIAINARDAMPEGGLLRMLTEDAVLGEEARRDGRFPISPGPYVCITISDTGGGISPEVLPHVFEPFFTTKPTGQGTGLGLAAVYGIVKDHGGMIRVDSSPGAGTSFQLFLPALLDMATPSVPKPSQAAPRTRGTVLLVDDEDVLRETVARMLASQGFEVIQGEDGQEGVELFEANRARIDLVILDMVMPRLSGADAFAKILAMDPRARVIIASGYARDASVTALLNAGLRGFLHKPFLKKELLEAIDTAMGEWDYGSG